MNIARSIRVAVQKVIQNQLLRLKKTPTENKVDATDVSLE